MAYVCATHRQDLIALIKARQRLEAGYTLVHVWFTDGSTSIQYTPADLPAVRQKIIFSM